MYKPLKSLKMKKNIIPVFLILIAVVSISCEKIEESSPVTINTSNTARLSGSVYAGLVVDKVSIIDATSQNPNYNATGILDTAEYVPEGTEIHFRVLKTAYNSKAQSGEMLRFVSTVNSNGSYSIDIPTTTEGVDVNISFDEFTANLVTWKYDSSSYNVFNPSFPTLTLWQADWYSSSSYGKKYSLLPTTNTLHTGENKFQNFTYN